MLIHRNNAMTNESETRNDKDKHEIERNAVNRFENVARRHHARERERDDHDKKDARDITCKSDHERNSCSKFVMDFHAIAI